MKIVAAAVFVAFLVAVAEGKHAFRGVADLNSLKVDPAYLMKHAVKVSEEEKQRLLGNNNNGNYNNRNNYYNNGNNQNRNNGNNGNNYQNQYSYYQQQAAKVQMSSKYSVQFNTCVSIPTQPSDDALLFSDSLISYTKKGQIVSQKSYVLFNVCPTNSCSYESNENLYMIDINSYMKAVTAYYADWTQSYCEACEDDRDHCV
jgi:hypothetical protein